MLSLSVRCILLATACSELRSPALYQSSTWSLANLVKLIQPQYWRLINVNVTQTCSIFTLGAAVFLTFRHKIHFHLYTVDGVCRSRAEAAPSEPETVWSGLVLVVYGVCGSQSRAQLGLACYYHQLH